jgi:hypothetical protein
LVVSATLHRYWFTFAADGPLALGYGCGITAWTQEDAELLLRQAFPQAPALVSVAEDVDVSGLDGGHVLPNMLPSNLRGVWFPMGVAQSG